MRFAKYYIKTFHSVKHIFEMFYLLVLVSVDWLFDQLLLLLSRGWSLVLSDASLNFDEGRMRVKSVNKEVKFLHKHFPLLAPLFTLFGRHFMKFLLENLNYLAV